MSTEGSLLTVSYVYSSSGSYTFETGEILIDYLLTFISQTAATYAAQTDDLFRTQMKALIHLMFRFATSSLSALTDSGPTLPTQLPWLRSASIKG